MWLKGFRGNSQGVDFSWSQSELRLQLISKLIENKEIQQAFFRSRTHTVFPLSPRFVNCLEPACEHPGVQTFFDSAKVIKLKVLDILKNVTNFCGQA